jgi:uncharacterized protein (TIGR03437 family)
VGGYDNFRVTIHHNPPVSAAPEITGGPVNAASYALNGLPNAGIAQGGMFVLFGRNLGPLEFQQVSAFPIPTQLGGTSVTVTVGGTTVNCLMLYTLDRQVAAILPSNTPVGTGTVRVIFNNQSSNTMAIQVVQRGLGIFTRNQAGSGPAIVQNFNSQSDQPINSVLEAAIPGQTVILWGTGLGPVTGDEAGGPRPGDMSGLPLEVWVGDKQASVTYRGRSGCCAGIDQIVFTVPNDVQGCYVSVAVVLGGVLSNSTTMAIAPQRGPCSDPVHVSSTDIAAIQSGGGVNFADIGLFRLAAKFALQEEGTIDTVEGNAEFAEAHFSRYNAADLLASVGSQSFPSAGSCTVQQFRYDGFFDSIFQDENPIPRQGIDAGTAISVTGPLGIKQMTKQSGSEGSYEARLGGISDEGPQLPDFLIPGAYTITNGAGGTTVGAFTTQTNVPANVVWSNRDSLPGVIPRTQPLSVTWTGADGATELVFIIGSSADPAAGSGASFACAANGSLGSFTVPAHIVRALPASGQEEEGRVGFLMVGKTPLRTASDGTIPNVQIVRQYYFLGNVINTNYQ